MVIIVAIPSSRFGSRIKFNPVNVRFSSESGARADVAVMTSLGPSWPVSVSRLIDVGRKGGGLRDLVALAAQFHSHMPADSIIPRARRLGAPRSVRTRKLARVVSGLCRL